MVAKPGQRRTLHELHAVSAISTPFLSPEFAQIWIRHYRDRWSLVLVLGQYMGELRGIMPLARQGSLLTGVGAHQAEYQGWLCEPSQSYAVLSGAIDVLFQTFPNARLQLRYIESPHAGVSAELARGRKNIFVQQHSKPLLTLDPDQIKSILSKKNNRSKVNRIKRDGELFFESAVDLTKFQSLFDSIITLYDFRQGAANNICPFLADPSKKPFHLDWFNAAPEHFRVACLRLNKEIIGAVVGVSDGSQTSIALLAFAPEYARDSPGRINLYYTAHFLAQAGEEYLDLTPGGNWKKRLADREIPVVELNAYGSQTQVLRVVVVGKLLGVLRRTVTSLGIAPSSVTAQLGRVRRMNLTTLTSRFRRCWPELTECRVYRIRLGWGGDQPATSKAEVNSLNHLVRFVPTEPWQHRQRFLSTALTRMESGHRSYTIGDNNKLVHCGWLVTYQEKSFLTEVGQSYTYPEPGAVLYDFYTAPDGRNCGYYQATIRQMLDDLNRSEDVSVAYISVLADNGPSRHAIEKIGFRHIGSLFRYRVLWHTKNWEQGEYENRRMEA